MLPQGLKPVYFASLSGTASQAAEKFADFICELFPSYFFAANFAWHASGAVSPVAFASSEHTPPRTYTAGISFTIRTRLAAVATKRKSQSTFLAPRSFTCRRILSSLPQPNTFSIRLRFF